ncbi:MAG: molecular chaperone [Flavobacteriales bacterium]|nr:molecular chaperone [Flavobacteriales bacterium]
MKNFIIIIIFCFPFIGRTQSDILITPFRVVFENGKSIEELSVANTGSDTARYTISFVQYKMNEDGQLQQIQTPENGQMFADRFLKVFPKSVVLAPKEAQIVRLQSKIPSDATPGEYRSHLYFRSAGEQKAIGFEAEGADGLGIQLIPIYGITIPIIVRVGASEVKTSITDMTVEQGENPAVNFAINRNGLYSVYGDLELFHIDITGKETMVGLVRGVAVYPPLDKRHVKIPFNKATGIPTSGKLRLVYTATINGKKQILATEDLLLK